MKAGGNGFLPELLPAFPSAIVIQPAYLQNNRKVQSASYFPEIFLIRVLYSSFFQKEIIIKFSEITGWEKEKGSTASLLNVAEYIIIHLERVFFISCQYPEAV